MRKEWKAADDFENFDKLYLAYKPKLLQYVITIIRDEDIAEDVVQEVFYEAIRQYDTFVNHPKPIGWLYITTKYKMSECIKKLKQHGELDLKPEQIEVCDFENRYNEIEMDMVIDDALTEEEALWFRRYFLWGETIAEIAEKENVTENNMRVRMSRLTKKIKNALWQKR